MPHIKSQASLVRRKQVESTDTVARMQETLTQYPRAISDVSPKQESLACSRSFLCAPERDCMFVEHAS